MKKYILLLLLFSSSAFSGEQERKIQLLCSAQAHIAKNVQKVRLETGDDWVDFHRKAKQFYKIDKGLKIVLHIADFIYHGKNGRPIDLPPDEVYVAYIYACVDARLPKEKPPIIEYSM